MDRKKIILIIMIVTGLIVSGAGVWFYGKRLTSKPVAQNLPKVELYFLPETLSVEPGEEFVVALRIKPAGKRITAQELYFSFDPALARLDKVSLSTAFPVELMPAKIDNNTGTASVVVGVYPTSPVVEEEDVVYLSFTAKDRLGEGFIRVENKSQVAAIGMTANVLEGFGALQLKINKEE